MSLKQLNFLKLLQINRYKLIINLEYSKLVTELEVDTGKNKINATIVERPFYDPKMPWLILENYSHGLIGKVFLDYS